MFRKMSYQYTKKVSNKTWVGKMKGKSYHEMEKDNAKKQK